MPIADSSRSSLPSSFARLRRITSDDAVKKRASRPAMHTSEASAQAMWVFPVPTSPMSTRSSRASTKDSASRSPLDRPSGSVTGDQSKPSSDLETGICARLSMRDLRAASREAASASR